MKTLSPLLWLVSAGVAATPALCAAEPQAPGRTNNFARAPYVQLATPDSMTVIWRTEGAIKPGVRFGTSIEQLDRRVTTSIVTRVALAINETEVKAGQDLQPGLARLPKLHSAPEGLFQYEARLTGLVPGTRYYYAVYDGDRRLTEPDPGHGFVTHPPPGRAQSARFWVVGDSGTGREAQHSVYMAMLKWVQSDQRPLDFWLHLGGMARTGGRDVEFQSRFFEVYETTLRQVVCWPTLGDEEGVTSDSGQGLGPYYDAFICPTRAEAGGIPSGTEAYYSFDYGRIHFICLNSHDADRKPTGTMARWLKLDLEQARTKSTDWVVAYFHHPAYTKGTHDSDREKQLIEMRTHIMPILDSGGADLVLSAHSHIYERSMLTDGAYATPTVAARAILNDGEGDPRNGPPYLKSAGLQPNGGALHVVAGNGGAALGRKGTMPLMRKVAVEHGSVIVDIEGDTLRGTMLNKFGQVRDVFALTKRGQVANQRLPKPWQPPPWTLRSPAAGSAAEPPNDFFVVIPKFAEWTYLAGDHPEGTRWTEVEFEAKGWRKGPAPFGFEYKEARTILDGMKGRSSVAYIRHAFELKRTDSIVELGLMINYDDGFIAYLNGQEVLRIGVGAGHGETAENVKSHDASRHSYFPLPDFEKHLRAGVNVLAIEGHNATIESRDLLLDPYLIIEE